MKFLCIYKPGKPEGTPPSQQEMDRMMAFIDESMKDGFLIGTEGYSPSSERSTRSPLGRQVYGDRRSLRRGERDHRGLCFDPCRLEGTGDRIYEEISGDCRRW